MEKITSFTQLTVWQKGHNIVLDIYRVTKTFPKEELFSLTDQIRRAAVSITSNIAEGFGRQSKKEKIQFYYISLGSSTELQNQLLISKDIGYLNSQEFKLIADKTVEFRKMLNALINKIKHG
ncbi:MAG: four helix bundle protein [Candidatus Woesebacteria bacterium]|nr:MAG: four helix bundle protein [Candidatus Woesebacteria bacterium]